MIAVGLAKLFVLFCIVEGRICGETLLIVYAGVSLTM